MYLPPEKLRGNGGEGQGLTSWIPTYGCRLMLRTQLCGSESLICSCGTKNTTLQPVSQELHLTGGRWLEFKADTNGKKVEIRLDPEWFNSGQLTGLAPGFGKCLVAVSK